MSTLLDIFSQEPSKPEQPAKRSRRRVDEPTPRLTAQQWRILEALGDGARLVVSQYPHLYELTWPSGIVEWHSRITINSLVKRSFLSWESTLTDAGRRALQVREQNKPGQL